MLKLRITIILFTLLFTSFTVAQSPAPRRGLLPTDLSAIRDVSDAQISPDGSRVVYVVSETTPDRVRTISRLWLVPTSGGESKRLTLGEANESFSESGPRWSPDGKQVAFYSNRDGRDGLWVVPAAGGEPKLTTHVFRTNFFLSKAGESFTWSPDGKRIAFLSSIEVLSDAPAMAAANTPTPAGLPAAATRPLSREDIHGGPHGMHGYGFNPNVQALAAQGYAVLLINPRGSSGYGQKFADGCVNDWGGGDYRDLMKGVDEALARWPFLDKNRLGVMGGSYGGYMTNWVVTQTDRFKAAVASASVSNMISFYATSLYQDLVHAEFNGFPWNNYELLWERSPVRHAAKVKTPLLLIHGEQDNDVHITQAEEMYTAVRMRGVDAVFVRYPREGHGLGEPRHREDSLARTLQWFDRYLKQ